MASHLTTDVAVIGAGSAGMTAYRAAKAQGARALLIEEGPYGTVCARVGCMPSKLLIAAAEAAHSIGHAAGFGIQAGPVRIDSRAVMARVQSERDRFAGFAVSQVEKMPPEDRLRGHARFVNARELEVDGVDRSRDDSGAVSPVRVTASSIVIATGSRPWVPEELHGAGDRLLTSDRIFELETLPESLAVVGLGAIGLELGQALHRLGVRVTLFGRGPGLALPSDPAVSDTALRRLKTELDIRIGTRILKLERQGERLLLHYLAADGTQRSESYAYVLAATGRMPNVRELGLARAGLQTDERGVPRFDPFTMQCGDSPVFIAGDAADERPFLHEATDQGRIAGSNAALFPQVSSGLRHAPLAIAFTDPQIAMVGASWRELQASQKLLGGQRFVVGAASFEDQGRSRVMLQNHGLLHLYADVQTGRFLGAEVTGPRAEHIAHLLAWACQNQMTVAQMLEMPYYHPVVEEGVRSALRDAREKLMAIVPEIEHCADCTPGT